MKNLLPAILLVFAISAHAQTINTLAGNGVSGFSGDNGPATAASLFGPYGIAGDAAGNVYFCDRFNNRVRKVSAAGTITTIGGTSTAGYNGDNMAATAAQLNDPNGIAIDATGNVYVADRSNHRIRKIDAGGNITTVAGTGASGYSGDNAAATAAQLNAPRGIAVDAAGNVYIADQANHRVRKLTIATGTIATVAGNGTQGFSGDNGPATAAAFNGIYALALDAAGNMYICDVDNVRIRKVSTTGIVTTIAGTGTLSYNGDNIPATAAHLNEPIGVAIDAAGNVIIADAWNSRIRMINPAGVINTIAGSGVLGYLGDGGLATAARFYYTYGIALTTTGELLIADHGNNRIRHTNISNVGVPQVNTALALDIFPNPSSGKFTLNIPSAANEKVRVAIFDLLGRQVYKSEMSVMPINIELDVPAGAYIVMANTRQGHYNQQILVTK